MASLGGSILADTSKGSVLETTKEPHSKHAEIVTTSLLQEEGRPVSKNQLKKLRRKQAWEDHKEDRKLRRKEKRHQQRIRRKLRNQATREEAKAIGLDPAEVLKAGRPQKAPRQLVPITFIIDCDFEPLMREPELVSLSTQITRSYAMNRTANYQAHIFVSSWKGWLKNRFETVFNSNHLRWQATHFIGDDYVVAAEQAQSLMAGQEGGKLVNVLRKPDSAVRPIPENEYPECAKEVTERETSSEFPVVYLTSDSPHTLERLDPYTSYVVGGIVDRNREKGVCYERATARGIRTAKLPISEYMEMASRKVLTTNHVIEIMLKWLECGDWGTAFANIIPKRKGGTLKGNEAQDINEESEEEQDMSSPPANYAEEFSSPQDEIGLEQEDACT
jgi:tRNA (guanine9-N1)-methyltransferase